MNTKKKSILDRIERLEDAIAKAEGYLKTGEHADWQGFRPLFTQKMRDGKILPPHPDWVRNVFLRRKRNALDYSYRLLEKIELKNLPTYE